MSVSKAVRTLAGQYKTSWLASEDTVRSVRRSGRPLDVLDHVVLLRQLALRRQKSLPNDVGMRPGMSVQIAGAAIRRNIDFLSQGHTHKEAVDVSVWCALLGEILASALCPRTEEAGGIYPAVETMRRYDKDWVRAHEPLYLLRNVICHPGAVLPHKKLLAQGFGEHHGALVASLSSRSGKSTSLDRSLLKEFEQHGPGAVQSEVLACWAFEKIDVLGWYEVMKLQS